MAIRKVVERTMEDRCRVVLDTGPVRDLAHITELPDWTNAFSRMMADGYCFSIADHACAELLNQRSKGAIDDIGFATIIDCLNAFLDSNMPVMLSGADILNAIGATRPDARLPSSSELSRLSWSKLCKQKIMPDSQFESVLEEERTEWKILFQKTEELYVAKGRPKLDEYKHSELNNLLLSMNAITTTTPPLSTRWDLRIRYFWRQFVRHKKEKGAYNTDAPKKRNDGIDFGLYSYLALPALAVAGESGFHEKIADIPSFQTSWIFRPEALAQSWSNGDHPKPRWP